jgi:UDP-glucose 4-epimerase
MSKPTLITGGCGFVGRHLTKRLLEEVKELWIIDNLSTGLHPDTWLKDWSKKIEGDLQIYSLDNKKIIFLGTDCLTFFANQVDKKEGIIELPAFKDVYHLASIVGGRLLIDGDPLLVATDLAIDASIFLWATRDSNNVERLLYASSSAAYPTDLQGEEKALALKEEFIDFSGRLGQPDMTYGWSKLSGEYLATLAHQKYNLHVACVRPFSGYGEDQDLTYPTPSIGLRIARHDSPIEVWGTGEQGRDFIHIDDCVDAMLVILDKVKDGRGINIGSGKLTSFNQLIEVFCKLEGHQADIKRLLDKPVGVQSRYADTTILNNEIGWKPKISLEEGLQRVLDHAHDSLKNNK